MKYGPWKIWNGGECPVDLGVKGQVQRACDTRNYAIGTLVGSLHNFHWNHYGKETDIIAYREVIEPKRETRTRETFLKLHNSDVFYHCLSNVDGAQPVTITLDLENGWIVGGTIKPRDTA